MKLTLTLTLLILAATLTVSAQTDTAYILSLYTRGINLDETKMDSIRYYAEQLSTEYKKTNYPYARLYSLRLNGYYFENKSDFEKAIDFYLQTLDEAHTLKDTEYEIAALTDLAAVYTIDLKQPEKAKEVYLKCVDLNKRRGDAHSLVATYTNLAAIYNRLGLYDSALIFLQEGLKISKPIEAKEDLSSLFNNLGNTYFYKKEYDESLSWFKKNYSKHAGTHNLADIWLDELNMADVYTEKGLYDSADKYASSSLLLAEKLNSKSKESDSYSILAKLYNKKGEYRKAYDYLQHWYTLDTGLVNAETYRAIAELQEKFNARERENEKLLLQAEIAQQKFHNRIMLVTAACLLVTVALVAIAFMIKRNVNRKLQSTNDLVIRQNEKLSELNYEKNSLISIVSHDLSTPFASIGMWTQVLEDEDFDAEKKKAIDKIRHSTNYGLTLIRNILDVEKAQTNQHKLNLENIDLCTLAGHIIGDFRPSAGRKNIRLHLELPPQPLSIMSDRQLLSRICGNLLSNAIKYTPQGKKVWMSISEEKDSVFIKVQDEGVGIEKEELPFLFTKYSKISSRPTLGEASTGLGLSIVKRLVEELNGKIFCESEKDQGSLFTVVFKK